MNLKIILCPELLIKIYDKKPHFRTTVRNELLVRINIMFGYKVFTST